MSTDYVKLVEREESALFVSLISRGFQPRHFRKSLDWDYGVAHHRYRDRGHYISAQDRSAVREVILKSHAEQQDFWGFYINRCSKAGAALMSVASELGDRDWSGASHSDLENGFADFAEATMDMVPFLMATVAVQPVLEDQLLESIATELPPEQGKEHALTLLPKLLTPSEEPDAVQEIRSAQRLADEAAANHDLATLIGGRVEEIHNRYPAFYNALSAHVSHFGWLRTHGYRFEPLTIEELLERIAGMIDRGGESTVQGPDPASKNFDLTDALGFTPSAKLAHMIEQLAELIHLRFYRIDVHLQADCVARPMFRAIADRLGCTREELIFASSDELHACLSTSTSLDLDEIRKRAANWFELSRDEDDLKLHSLTSPLSSEPHTQPPSEGLMGMTASRGRASGQAKVLFGASEVQKVARGDILITTMTTPDLMLAIENSAAIVTDEGGILSHAAIISRELGIPCVIGTEHATRSFRDGDVLEVDATQPNGRVRRSSEAY